MKRVEKQIVCGVVKNLIVRDRKFKIVVNEDGYFCAIEDKYITDGVINTTLNGAQMHASKEIALCIRSTIDACEIDYLVENGATKTEAFCKVYGLDPERLAPMLKNIFG